MLAEAFCPDVIVCIDEDQVKELDSLAHRGIEICALRDYPGSRAELNRSRWLETQNLAKLKQSEMQETLRRAALYSEEIVVLDRMIGKWAIKSSPRSINVAAKGIVRIAEHGATNEQYYPKSGISVHVVTEGGGQGASSGYVDPSAARRSIKNAIEAADRNGVIGRLTVTLKKDRRVPIFRDRYVKCGIRCWGIQHGIDDFGRLDLPSSKRGPTLIVPDCEAHRDLVNEILNLEDA